MAVDKVNVTCLILLSSFQVLKNIKSLETLCADSKAPPEQTDSGEEKPTDLVSDWLPVCRTRAPGRLRRSAAHFVVDV